MLSNVSNNHFGIIPPTLLQIEKIRFFLAFVLVLGIEDIYKITYCYIVWTYDGTK